MENFNVGAVVFALLIGLWLVYAMPRFADRRRILGEVEKVSAQRHSGSARDLTHAVRTYSRQREVEVMRDNRQILRPADPTSRPRFDLPQSEADLGARVIAPAPRLNRVLTAILLSLIVVTVALLVLAAVGAMSVWASVASCGLLFAYIAGLRVTKNARKASGASAPHQSSSAATPPHTSAEAETERGDAAPASASSMANGVANPSERHEAFVRKVLEARQGVAAGTRDASESETFRYGSLSSQSNLEEAQLEEREAVEETHGRFLGAERQVIGSGLTVDEILERRRA